MSLAASDSSRPARRFRVEVSQDPSQVQAPWAALEGEGTPFQSRAWLAPWYRIVAPKHGAQPLFVTVRDEETREPVVFLPLCRRRWRGVATVEFPDLEVSDYNAPLTARGLDLNAEEMRGLWVQIGRALPPADVFRLEKSPATAENPFARLDWVQEMDIRGWPLPLPATLEAYETQVLSRKTRKEHRRKRKNLTERVGELRLETATTPEDGERLFEALRRERLARFGPENLLEDPCFGRFYREVMFDDWGALGCLTALKSGDRILAAQFSLRWRGSRLLIMHAFEPELERLSAGVVAIDELIAGSIAAGDACLDFTVGNEGYKREFGVKEMRLLGGLYPLSAFGRLFTVAYPQLVEGKKALKRHLSAWRNGARAAPAPADG